MRKSWLACSLLLLNSTAFGVQLVKDLNTVPTGDLSFTSSFTQAVQTTGGVFFLARDDDHGTEPWVTDGTPAGTRLLRDIRPGLASSEIDKITLVNGIVLFAANDGANGKEIWRSDGTPDGTRVVANIGPGSTDGISAIGPNYAVIGDVLYFSASTDGPTGEELWRTDGTAAGTYRLTDGVPGSIGIQPMNFQVVGTRLYFLAYDAAGETLWTSDGTVNGSRRVANGNATTNSSIAWLRVVDDALFFPGYDSTHGHELWRADAAGNVTMVADLLPGASSSGPFHIGVGNHRLIFAALTNNGFNLLSVTTTSATPTMVDPSILANYEIEGVTESPGGLLITWRHPSGFILPLYMTDGTSAGTGFVASELRMSYPGVAKREGSWIYFFGQEVAGAPANIYRSGGTVATTSLYATIDNPAPGLELEALNGRLYFFNGRFNDPVHGNELWSTDGTPQGTQMLADLAPGTSDTRPSELVAIGNRMYLALSDGEASFDPWSTDGTTAPVQLADLGAIGVNQDSEPWLVGNVGALTLFGATDGVNGRQLWSTNGTDAGTRMLTNNPLNGGFDPARGYIAMNGYGLFVGISAAGAELWRSDGTPAGTIMVKDIAAAPAEGNPYLFDGVALNGVAYFLANDGAHGKELWRSDGTTAGTWMVFDAAPGAADGADSMFHASANGRVFVRGRATEIYASDGTAAGSVTVSNGANTNGGVFAFQNRVCMYVGIVNSGTGEYHCSDGTAGNFVQFTDFVGMGLAPSGNPFVVNGVVLISAGQIGGGSGGGIYAFDGSGTPPVKISDLRFNNGIHIDGGTRLAFTPDFVGGDIVVTDGTTGGTRSMLNGTSAPRSQILYGGFAAVNDSLLFRVIDPVNGPAVWKTDGTAAGTRFLFDVDPGTSTNRVPEGFLQNGNTVYFSAYRSGIGNELWSFSTLAPNANDDYVDNAYGASINLSVAANDSDFDSSLPAPGIEIVTAPANGTATLGSGVITYTPNSGFTGIDRFAYRVFDAQGNPSNAAYANVTTLGPSSGTGPGTPPAPPPPPPPPPSPQPPGNGGGGGGTFGWELLLLALLLWPRVRRAYGTEADRQVMHRRRASS